MIYRLCTILCLILLIISCRNQSSNDSTLFTDLDQINPKIYFDSEANNANDPSIELLSFFRKKKADDMNNPNKPRPFPKEEITKIENISSQQEWAKLEDIFTWQWSDENLKRKSENVKARMIFDNPDLKVIELAIAPKATLPLNAEATPSVYHILGGSGRISSSDSVRTVTIGTSVFFDSNSPKKVESTSDDPLKILWFRWAPQGDPSYLESGYYLTGANIHIQPKEAILPEDFDFWQNTPNSLKTSSSYFSQSLNTTGNFKDYYPNTRTYTNEKDIKWVDVVNLDPKSFFFAEDIKSLGPVLDMLKQIAKIKSVFRAKRPDKGYDLNYSYLAWGPDSKYVTHSHAICEFYYILEGDVEYIIDNTEYNGIPGNFYFHPPYYDHEMRGMKSDIPFLSISGSWIPYGDRKLFDEPFTLLEVIKADDSNGLSEKFDFHDFDIKPYK